MNYTDGRWHNVVHTFWRNIGGQKIFIDGVQKASGAKALSDFTWQTGINIGFSNDASNNFFNSTIDEVRIYNRALSDAEIQALYNATN